MYKVEYLNEFGEWIYSSWHKNSEFAFINATVKAKAGLKSRVIHKGQIIAQYEPSVGVTV